MISADEIKTVFNEWKITSDRKPYSYRYQEFIQFLIEVCPSTDFSSLMFELKALQLIAYSAKHVVITKKGFNLIPKERFMHAAKIQPHMPGSESEWKDFRTLMQYYIECVRVEDRKEYRLKAEKEGIQFFIPKSINPNWLQSRESPRHPDFIVSFPPEAFPMFNAVRKSNQTVAIGYPIEVSFDSSGVALYYTPLFLIPVKYVKTLPGSNLPGAPQKVQLEIDFKNASYNYEWIRRNCDMSYYSEILEALAPDGKGLDVAVALKGGILTYADIDGISEIDSALTIQHLPSVTRKGQRKRLCNTVALFRMQSTVFNKNLLSELTAISTASAEELDQTALAYIYRKHPFPIDSDCQYAAIPFLDSNSEQLDSVKRAFENHLSVLQGPPGTGKSQVAVNMIANCIYNDKSVVFSSRNHAALDAIRNRAQSLIDSESSMPLVQYCKTESNAALDWFSIDVEKRLSSLLGNYNENAASSAEILTIAADTINKIDEVEEQEEEKLSRYFSSEKEYVAVTNKIKAYLFNLASYDHIDEILRYSAIINKYSETGLLSGIRRIFNRKRILNAKKKLLDEYNIIPSYHPDRESYLIKLCKELSVLGKEYSRSKDECNKAYHLYKAELPNVDLCRRYNAAIDDMTRNSIPAIVYRWCRSAEALSEDDRTSLEQGCTLANKKNGKYLSSDEKRKIAIADKKLQKIIPAWAVSLQSAVHVSPLIPGIFDFAIIDEASQCDCVSVIPILFRARNAVIIGDPEQFRPIITMTKLRHDTIWEKFFAADDEIHRFNFYSNTAYSIASRYAASGMLKEHFRCDEAISGFINEAFYNGELRILTNRKNQNFPSCFNDNEHFQWIDTDSGQDSEFSECLNVIRRIKGCGFNGSIGVVTPFRNVADKLSNIIYGEGYSEESVKVNTAYGFQGGECDVIIFVLSFDDSIIGKKLWYITDESNRNIFDVAISRAKSCLIIIGDRARCRNSGSKTLRLLASYPKEDIKTAEFDSEWEKKLFDALENAGIKTIPQYRFRGYKFDLAYIDENIQLDIEVDGYRYHFNDDGSRKASDFQRDAVSEKYGWKTMRFVVKELYEDMDGCVDKIKAEISHNRNVRNANCMEMTESEFRAAFAKALQKNNGTTSMHPMKIGKYDIDFAYDQDGIKLAVLLVNSGNQHAVIAKNTLIKEGWTVLVYLESDVRCDLPGTVSEIDNYLTDLTDAASETSVDMPEMSE